MIVCAWRPAPAFSLLLVSYKGSDLSQTDFIEVPRLQHHRSLRRAKEKPRREGRADSSSCRKLGIASGYTLALLEVQRQVVSLREIVRDALMAIDASAIYFLHRVMLERELLVERHVRDVVTVATFT